MSEVECRFFNGYKPCAKSENCDQSCEFIDIPRFRIAIVHLGAIGAVVRSTALLSAIKEKYPSSVINWVTEPVCVNLLSGHPKVDHVVPANFDGLLFMETGQYDICFCIDKSAKAIAIAQRIGAAENFGFTAHPRSGAIIPVNPEAEYLWSLGLSNEKKFFENKKSEVQLMVEALKLGHRVPEYELPLGQRELELSEQRRKLWGGAVPIIGINTGCANTIEHKKLTVDGHIKLIKILQSRFNNKIVLLGGPEDTVRNRQIAQATGAIESPTVRGLRDGLASVNACDVVVTGDSLGMHMAISQKKFVVAWFGATCSHEIEFYGRGAAIETEAKCSPCWKRTCDEPVMCYDQVDFGKVMKAVERGLGGVCQTQLSF